MSDAHQQLRERQAAVIALGRAERARAGKCPCRGVDELCPCQNRPPTNEADSSNSKSNTVQLSENAVEK